MSYIYISRLCLLLVPACSLQRSNAYTGIHQCGSLSQASVPSNITPQILCASNLPHAAPETQHADNYAQHPQPFLREQGDRGFHPTMHQNQACVITYWLSRQRRLRVGGG
ncbi:hypothetical protein F5Y08DRAFT_317387 [Xylaria arbuscula]|nr:hypothetical protein F5Y08DRAFT_317387 [Xylaria arbuscula]